MVERWLYCEGKTDAPVLKAVFSALAIDIIAESTGSSPGRVANWRREQGIIAAAISDRDYRPASRCVECNVAGSVKLIWRRHSIENYLLDPEVVTIAMQRFKESLTRLTHPPECTKVLPTDLKAVRQDLIAAGKRLIPQESGCLTIERLKYNHSDPVGRVQLRIPSLLIRGDSPSQSECRTAVVEEIVRVIDAAEKTESLDEFTDVKVVDLYDAITNEISDATYLNDLKFLEVFHGKRLFQSLRHVLNSKYGFAPKKETFQTELISAVESLVSNSEDCSVAQDFLKVATIVMKLEKPSSD